MTKCRIIHHDISSGNILVLPKLEQKAGDDDSKGLMEVHWRGLLGDWEHSKPISENIEDGVAREPERTVSL